ncbi:hypothetical protein KVR01_010041 [Diaporthe batatas]|uniref:uncharacterized protein n=1 Tax=Diaporthe batatas TaxID=748121 RepID=UPI001D04C8B2|nr:uncharacterized protein KVR01_010041 [Diaporthe batatas]KAG8160505.1 hypothetical protein KVR01_010041 [Diaporthe batatas]
MGNTISTCLKANLGHVRKRHSIQPATGISEAMAEFMPDEKQTPPYFWGEEWNQERRFKQHVKHSGYEEARILIGRGSQSDIERNISKGLKAVSTAYRVLDEDKCDSQSKQHGPDPDISYQQQLDSINIIDVCLSDDLMAWKREHHALGRISSDSHRGRRRASNEVIQLLGAEDWPAPLLTTDVLFGAGLMNMLIGAYDARVLYSNYCIDTDSFNEPQSERSSPRSNRSASVFSAFPKSQIPLGLERRRAVESGLTYTHDKSQLEARHETRLNGCTAKMDRETAHVVHFCEANRAGIAAEAMGRCFDSAAIYDDMVFSSAATDIVNIHSDLGSSEIANACLNTADITNSGVVTEDALRRVYDAFAAVGARCLTERWSEPGGGMNGMLYVWHILNDRSSFLRKAVLGWSKIRRDDIKGGQREADFDEVFDVNYHTTGYSRCLKVACNGAELCDGVERLLETAGTRNKELLRKLWMCLAGWPVNYAKGGIVDADREEGIVQSLATALAQVYHDGLVLEEQWLIAHAHHHAWQINYLMEAAMFGGLLDGDRLTGNVG